MGFREVQPGWIPSNAPRPDGRTRQRHPSIRWQKGGPFRYPCLKLTSNPQDFWGKHSELPSYRAQPALRWYGPAPDMQPQDFPCFSTFGFVCCRLITGHHMTTAVKILKSFVVLHGFTKANVWAFCVRTERGIHFTMIECGDPKQSTLVASVEILNSYVLMDLLGNPSFSTPSR